MNRISGEYEKLGHLEYFIPYPLPPNEPIFIMDMELTELYGKAMHALGQLNEMAQRLPNINRFIKAYVISEALLSSAIEGIHTTRLDVLASAQDTRPNKETQLVLNYTNALDVAISLVKKENMPITSRVILAAHKELMSHGTGEKASPGQYRKQPVQVGQLTPPPAQKISQLLTELERFINAENNLPPLVKAGLVHVQFETIHPFLDGNGRIGRMLIVLMMMESNLLCAPIMYPSYYFKKQHMAYYQKLDIVRTKGDFEAWMSFFLNAIIESSLDAYKRAKEIEQLEKDIIEDIHVNSTFKGMAERAIESLTIFFEKPVINVSELSKTLDKSYNTANKLINQFVEAGVLNELTSQKRNKVYQFTKYLTVLEKEY